MKLTPLYLLPVFSQRHRHKALNRMIHFTVKLKMDSLEFGIHFKETKENVLLPKIAHMFY